MLIRCDFRRWWWTTSFVLTLNYSICRSQFDTYTLPNNALRRNRQYATTSMVNPPCEYKEVMMKLNDDISMLHTLKDDLGNRLEIIDKKVSQFEANNLSRLDAIAVEQGDMLNRIDDISRMQNVTIEKLKELYLARSMAKMEPLSSDITARMGNSQKFDALATLLASTSAALHSLEMQIQGNFSKLLMATNSVQRRVNSLQRRNHNAMLSGQTNFYVPANTQQELITNCVQPTYTTSGIVKLQLTTTSEPFYIYCDEQNFKGGWAVILNRFSGDVNFQRDWQEYRTGFGNLAGEFFLGLDKIHALTSSAVHELIVVLEDFEGVQRFANYDLFAIGNEQESYALNLLGKYEGNAGDALSYHAGQKFSTYDKDNDGCLECNCAQAHMGAWWYNWCEMSNLNGKYFANNYNSTPLYQGIYWHQFHGPNYSLKAVRMMIRPVVAEQESRR